MTREELAQLVLDMLAGQQKYFRDRSSENLVVWKQAERKVKEACEALVKPQRSLFDAPKERFHLYCDFGSCHDGSHTSILESFDTVAEAEASRATWIDSSPVDAVEGRFVIIKGVLVEELP